MLMLRKPKAITNGTGIESMLLRGGDFFLISKMCSAVKPAIDEAFLSLPDPT
jgi:hypothetical protein